jgi:hypothetical protein
LEVKRMLQIWQKEIIAFWYGIDADNVIEFCETFFPPEGDKDGSEQEASREPDRSRFGQRE